MEERRKGRKRKRDQEEPAMSESENEEFNSGSEDAPGEDDDEFQSASGRASVTSSEVSGDEDEDEDADGEWDAEGDDDDERGTMKKLCLHCGEDEDNDPGEEYEDPLECRGCGAFSHGQCDRDANESGGVKSQMNEETQQWNCPSCSAMPPDPDPSTTMGTTSTTPRPRSRPKPVSPVPESSSRPRSRPLRNHALSPNEEDEDEEEDDQPISARRRRPNRQSSKKKANGIVTAPTSPTAPSRSRSRSSSIVPLVNGNPSGHTKRKKEGQSAVVAVKRETNPTRLIISITNLPPDELQHITMAVGPQNRKKSSRARPRKVSNTPAAPKRSAPTANAAAAPSQHFPAPGAAYLPPLYDDDNSKPYGGILSEEDADTSLTLPGEDARDQFTKAMEKVEKEKEARKKQAQAQATGKKTQTDGITRIECIHFGNFEIDTWYAAPYPEEYNRNRVLWICEFCLKYMNSEFVAYRHKIKCACRHPPGDEIYRSDSISIFEIDGRKNPVYCQNLCLLAKLFLGSKTLYYDVEPFLFYVMTEYDEDGMHFVGYFSKEKRSTSQNNVSCILTLPIHQRKGYGNLLIAFSYLLTRRESKTGSPEKPFSDLGLVSYRNYWKLTLCYELRQQKSPVSIPDLSKRTGMTHDDIVCGLEALKALVRDPVTGIYALRLDYAVIESVVDRWEKKGYVVLDESKLVWSPYVLGNKEREVLNDMPMATIAPREGEAEAAAAAPNPGGKENRNPLPNGDTTSRKRKRALSTAAYAPAPIASTPEDAIALVAEIPAARFQVVPAAPNASQLAKRQRRRERDRERREMVAAPRAGTRTTGRRRAGMRKDEEEEEDGRGSRTPALRGRGTRSGTREVSATPSVTGGRTMAVGKGKAIVAKAPRGRGVVNAADDDAEDGTWN